MRIFSAIAALALLAACSAEREDRGDEAVTVVAQPVNFLADEEVIEAIGTARAARTAEIFPEVSGRVVAVRFGPGSYVRSGQTLVELDARRERLALRLAEVRVEEAEQLLGRYRRIEDTGALSESQIEAGENAVAAARIERDQAAAILAERTIRAPFSGHISFTEIDIGDRVTPDTLIAQLDERSRLYVDFNAPESVFRRLRTGDNVQISAFSDPDTLIAVPIEAVGTTIEEDQRSYRARTLLDNRDDRYRPGMSFSVRFVGQGQTRASAPEAAVMWTGDGSSIFIVRDGAAVRVPVTITSRRDGIALLDGQIEPETLIIIEGVQKVREGQAVNLVQQPVRDATEVEVTAS